MIHFEEERRVSHPADLVLETMVERMESIVPFLKTVEAIETISREELGDGRFRILRRWQGTDAGAPEKLRPFLSRESLAWMDTADWTPADYRVDWRIDTSAGKLYECSGTNFFGPHPEDPEGSTLIRVTGDLAVYPDRLPGVPGFLGRRMAPTVEKFVVNLLTPNLIELAVGLQGYLDDQS
ncbi:MAG: hypothetical protein VYE15_06305 [Myxococcota bacterium]|nr:hypothetical protein [Myxococcota bacterium]